MKKINITHYTNNKKGNTYHQTVYYNTKSNIFGFVSKDGIAFTKYIKGRKEILKRPNGFTRWYFSNRTQLVEAVRVIRKWYGLTVKTNKSWQKLRVKIKPFGSANHEINDIVKSIYLELNT